MSRPRGGLGLLTGFILLTATGFTDAYTFLRHGHVFVEAMTGNLVLVGVGAVQPSIVAFWRPLLSYLAFLSGVAILWLACRRRPSEPAQPQRERPVQLLTLSVEVIVLGAVGFLRRSFPQEVIVAAISLAAGLQISAFRRLADADLSTVVMTTNSVQAIGAALDALGSRNRDAILVTRGLLVALAGFIVGVFLGALLSSWLHNRAAWPDSALFLSVALLLASFRPAHGGYTRSPAGP